MLHRCRPSDLLLQTCLSLGIGSCETGQKCAAGAWSASCFALVRRGETMELNGVVRRVRSEFLEMPGLHLTPAQAQRLWGLEGELCRAVIDALVAEAVLRRTLS